MSYTVTRVHNVETSFEKFERHLKMLHLSMKLKMNPDHIYHNAKYVARDALNYLDMRDGLKE